MTDRLSDPEIEKFILDNKSSLSARQMAKRLCISRAEIDEIISRSAKSAKPTAEKKNTRIELVWVLIVAGLALAVRLYYIWLLKKTPFFEPLGLLAEEKLDDGLYWWMAQEITKGNWLGVFPLGAYRIPLYAYFLAVLVHFTGIALMPVHLAQALIGSLSAALIYTLSCLVLDRPRAAKIAGILGAIYVPLIFFEHLIVGETLSIFLNLAAACLSVQALCSGKLRVPKFFAAGLLLGLSSLLRPNTLLVVAGVGVFLLYRYRRPPCERSLDAAKGAPNAPPRDGVRPLALVLAFWLGAILPVAGITVRNYAAYKDLLPISAIGGINFYMGNGPGADGKFRLIEGMGTGLDQIIANSERTAERELGRPLKPSEASAFWMKKTVAYLVSNPVHAVAVLSRKIALFFNNYEFPDILDINFAAKFIPFLCLGTSGSYGILVLTALYGGFLLWKKRNTGLELVGVFFLSYTFSVVLFIITARYRLPAAPFMIVFAAYGIDHLILEKQNGNSKALGRAALLCLVPAFIVFWPVERTDFATNYNSLAISLKYRGDLTGAERSYREAIRISPNYPSPYYNLGKLLDKMGRNSEAAEFYKKYEVLKKEVFKEK